VIFGALVPMVAWFDVSLEAIRDQVPCLVRRRHGVDGAQHGSGHDDVSRAALRRSSGPDLGQVLQCCRG
jgi:hypothetical protein